MTNWYHSWTTYWEKQANTMLLIVILFDIAWIVWIIALQKHNITRLDPDFNSTS